MAIKRTLDNTVDVIKYFGNTAWDIIRAVYDNLGSITTLAALVAGVDNLLAQSSVALKVPVITATTGNITLSGTQTVDGVVLVNLDRILVKNQIDLSENGIYIVSNGAWARAIDWDGEEDVIDVVEGTLVSVNRGTVNLNSMWKVTTEDDIVIGTTEVEFIQVPLPLEIESDVTSSEFCPGYTFTFSDTNTFLVEDFNVTNIFSVNRRIKFIIGGVSTYGVIASSSFSTDTTINMTMEDDAVLADVAYEVCLTAGIAAWSPIATDPFEASSINAIISGTIGITVYWQVVGDSGKVFYSIDKGITWTAGTGYSTSVDFNGVAYDSNNKVFMVVGDDGVFMTSADGITWTIDTTSIKALPFNGGTQDCYDVAFDTSDDAWIILWQRNAISGGTASSTDGGATWTQRDTLAEGANSGRWLGFIAYDVFHRTYVGENNTQLYYYNTAATASASLWSTSMGGSTPQCFAAFNNGGTSSNGVTGAVGTLLGHMLTFTGTSMVRDDVNGSNGVNGVTYSSVLDRFVCVTDLGEIFYIDEGDWLTVDSWTSVNNGFTPTANIQDVHYDVTDLVFIAVADNGQICRSTNGTN